jgi:glycosyltransferase involved in cell wall biosynthesis
VNQGISKINLMLFIAGLHHGGAERVIESLCKHLDPDRFAITVCWRLGFGNIGEELKADGFTLVGLPEINPDVSPYLRFLVLKNLLKERQIDIIHTHDTGSLVDAAQCRLLGSKTKIVHTFHFGNYPNLKKTYLYMERIFSRFAHRLIAVGHEQEKLIQQALHLDKSRLSTLYNGVEQSSRTTDVDFISNYRDSPRNPVVIGSISTLTDQKGLFILLDTAALLRDKGANCVFIIAGDGPLRSRLEEKTQRLGLGDMVHFLGWVPRAADMLLPSLDLFCQSSLWEANSIVLLEAMANGLPIVTTDVGESRHVIDHERNGMVVKPGDPVSLAEALMRLISSAQQCESMGKLAQDKFVERYTVDIMAKNYHAVYEELLQ